MLFPVPDVTLILERSVLLAQHLNTLFHALHQPANHRPANPLQARHEARTPHGPGSPPRAAHELHDTGPDAQPPLGPRGSLHQGQHVREEQCGEQQQREHAGLDQAAEVGAARVLGLGRRVVYGGQGGAEGGDLRGGQGGRKGGVEVGEAGDVLGALEGRVVCRRREVRLFGCDGDFCEALVVLASLLWPPFNLAGVD